MNERTSRVYTSRTLAGIVAIGCGLAVMLASAPAAQAVDIVVTTTAHEMIDNGNCSLQEAIKAAETDQPVDACPAGDGDDNIIIPTEAWDMEADFDGDGIPDACDPDNDDDGVTDEDDNCMFTPNPGQEDLNGNGWGDACEMDFIDLTGGACTVTTKSPLGQAHYFWLAGLVGLILVTRRLRKPRAGQMR